MAEHLRLINREAPPEGGWFVMTETARDMLRSLDQVRELFGGGMTMIAAAPGTGKSATVWRYLQANRRTFIVEAFSGEGGIWSAAIGVFKALDLGEPNSRDLPGDREKIAEAVGADGMLIIDEVQYLIQKNPRGKDNIDALDWLRRISEEGCCCIVFVGDLALVDAVEKLPQFKRRLRRPVIVRRVSKVDVEAVAAKSGFHDPAVINLLFAVARRAGGLGDVAHVLSHAAIFAAGRKVPHMALRSEDRATVARILPCHACKVCTTDV